MANYGFYVILKTMNINIKKDWQENIKILLAIVVLMWVIELISSLFGQPLNRFGIRPRSIAGLSGIIFAPILHGSISHLASNTIPFLVLGFFVMLKGLPQYIKTTAIIWIIGGLGTWLFGGPNTVHLGASIIIFGYLGYLLASAYFERSLSTLLVAIVVGVLYGTMIFGVLPITKGVSWQGHLFGLLGGVLSAQLASKNREAF